MRLYSSSNEFQRHQFYKRRKSLKRNRIIKKRGPQKRKNGIEQKRMSFQVVPYTVPETFSFIDNYEGSMLFFEKLLSQPKNKRIKHVIYMNNVTRMTMEVLLYLTSITNIWKTKNYKYKIEIKAPNNQELRILLAKSGLGKYFRGDGSGHIDEENIYPICDGGEYTISPSLNMSQNDRCIDIREFAERMFLKIDDLDKSGLKQKLFDLTNVLAEMMRNTDDHAYDEDNQFTILRNWYFFAARIRDGVSFYFFDNGKGIIKTAKRFFKDTASKVNPVAVEELDILTDALEGKFRSRTNLPNRNKGLPEIKSFFDSEDTILSSVITNHVLYIKDKDKVNLRKTNHHFGGTLYIWVVK